MVFEELVDELAVLPVLWQTCLYRSQDMVLPDFPQTFIEEEIQVDPLAVIGDPAACDEAVEMDVELHILAEGMQNGGYTREDTPTFQLMAEDVHYDAEDLPESNCYEFPVILHQSPQFVRKCEDTMTMRTVEQVPLHLIGPFIGHTTAT
jgi:hypothetical protein